MYLRYPLRLTSLENLMDLYPDHDINMRLSTKVRSTYSAYSTYLTRCYVCCLEHSNNGDYLYRHDHETFLPLPLLAWKVSSDLQSFLRLPSPSFYPFPLPHSLC